MSQVAKRVFLKGTKTDRARVVPLSSTMVAALKAQRSLQAADRLALGPAYSVDPSESGLYKRARRAALAQGRYERIRAPCYSR